MNPASEFQEKLNSFQMEKFVIRESALSDESEEKLMATRYINGGPDAENIDFHSDKLVNEVANSATF